MDDPMTYVAFTVDVDRDANMPTHGKVGGISRPIEGDRTPRFSSSALGLELLVDLLDEMGVKGTFFLEARTASEISKEMSIKDLLAKHEIGCHGFEHEDLTGKDTGIPLSKDDVYFIIENANTSLGQLTGRKPIGFRAPYLNLGEDVLDVVQEIGFEYDSSLTRDLSDHPVSPWLLPNELVEVPLAIGKDVHGKRIYSYLWAMHEEKRVPGDYIRLMERAGGGFLVLATHSWHLVETFLRGKLDPDQVKRGLGSVRSVIEGALDLELEFLSIEDFLVRHLGRN
jgi:peptidoglycan/xylan/chitin deacetylase (PgdA/CDA1 family)